MTEKKKHLIRQHLWSVIYRQRAVLKSARSFIGTDSEWLAQHVIKHYPKHLHNGIKLLRMIRDSRGHIDVAKFIKNYLEKTNQSIEQYLEDSKKIHCFDQAVLLRVPRIWPRLVKNEIL